MKKEQLFDFDLDLVNGGLVIKNCKTGHTCKYDVSKNIDMLKLRIEFQKNNQERDIDITYKEYVTLVDSGILPKDEVVYNFAMSNL